MNSPFGFDRYPTALRATGVGDQRGHVTVEAWSEQVQDGKTL